MSSISTLHNPLCYSGLIDANGRMLDPVVGRFLSVDPVYQAPTNSQSVNPYSYVMNNPLSLTDPSGYTACPGESSNDQSTCTDGPRLYKGHNDTGTMDHLGGMKLARFDAAVKAVFGNKSSGFLLHGEAALEIVGNGNGAVDGNNTDKPNTLSADIMAPSGTTARSTASGAGSNDTPPPATEDEEAKLANKSFQDLGSAVDAYKKAHPERWDIGSKGLAKLKLNLIRGFSKGQNAETCKAGCIVGDWDSANPTRINVYLGAALASGVTTEGGNSYDGYSHGMMYLLAHEYEHSTATNIYIEKEYVASHLDEDIVTEENIRNEHDLLPWELDANTFARHVTESFNEHPPN